LDIVHIVSLYTDEHYAATSAVRTVLEVVMFDHTAQDLSDVDRIARWVVECLGDGPTLVHCHMGLNRSGVVIARALMLLGMDARSAIALERSRRSPACLNNPAFERWLLAHDGTHD
jgi:protein-tyrosine phosphatase